MTDPASSTADDESIVWIVRYGLTKYPLVENKGPYDSPIDPTEGMEHAKAIATRIASDPDKPSVVYSSPFLRTTETAHQIALACSCQVRIEEGLTEWQTPSLLVDPSGVRTYPKSTAELAQLFSSVDDSYSSVNPVAADEDDNENSNTRDGAPRFPESEDDMLSRCAKTMEGLAKNHSGAAASICIVSHAPCDQAIAYFLEGAATPAASRLTPWPLGGITKFTNGKLVLYGDTQHMSGIYKAGTKHWSLPCLDKK